MRIGCENIVVKIIKFEYPRIAIIYKWNIFYYSIFKIFYFPICLFNNDIWSFNEHWYK